MIGSPSFASDLSEETEETVTRGRAPGIVVGGLDAPRIPIGFDGALLMRRRSRKEYLVLVGLSGVGGNGPVGGGAGDGIEIPLSDPPEAPGWPLLMLRRRKGSNGRA